MCMRLKKFNNSEIHRALPSFGANKHKRIMIRSLPESLDFGGVCVTHLFSFLCCALFVFVLCAQYWVSLDCSFLITPSVYSKVYWRYQYPGSCKSEDRQCNDQSKKDKDEQWSTTENRKNGEIVTATNREHIRGNLWSGYSPTGNQGLMATVNISTFTLNQENHLIQ